MSHLFTGETLKFFDAFIIISKEIIPSTKTNIKYGLKSSFDSMVHIAKDPSKMVVLAYSTNYLTAAGTIFDSNSIP